MAHSILIIVYHLIQRGSVYQALGANYYDKRKAAAVQSQLVKRLERLGFTVTLQATSPVA